jgi:N-methylhydantoinase A
MYGRGSSYRDARLELVTFRVRASAQSQPVSLPAATRLRTKPAAGALTGKRSVYWTDAGKASMTPIVDGARLVAGNRIDGPAIVETTETTIVVHPGQQLRVDPLGNFELLFAH